jgi:hypothetical protein
LNKRVYREFSSCIFGGGKQARQKKSPESSGRTIETCPGNLHSLPEKQKEESEEEKLS